MNQYSEWLNNLKSVWEQKDLNLLSSIISNNTQYFESVFKDPLISNTDVVNQWKKDLENQSDIHFEYEILMENENGCIANWKAKFKSNGIQYDMDGIFYFRLDSENRCIYFKQWWVNKK